MKKNLLILPMIGLILVLVCPNASGQTWNLTWSDEFNGTGAPDSTKWDRPQYNRQDNPDGPDGWWDQDDSYLEGGNLVIRVRRVPNRNADSDPYDYSVGAIRTLGKFMPTYGKFEIRAQMPVMQGWWVAFWMMQGNQNQVGNGGVDGSEVDIFEGWGWTDKISHAVHWDGYGPGSGSVSSIEDIPGIRTGWHTFTLIWNPSIYKFYVDGIERWTTTGAGVCNQPGYIKLTGEISTKPAAITDNWARNPEGVPYPDYYLVDYVRYYSASPGVVFYQNVGYGGASSQSIQPGTYTMAQLANMGVPNDWASSIQIPDGWMVTMYEHDNFTGQSWTLTGDASNFAVLANSANDKVSSCVIQYVGANLALNKPATQSSTFGLPTAVAASAADGNKDGDFFHGSVASTSDNSTNQPWWQVDLGAAAKINAINVWNRTDCCSSRLTNYHIFVSNSPFTSATVAGTQAQAGVKDYFHAGIAGTPSSIVVNDTGRYVRLQLESTDVAINLAELQVYGTLINTTARLNANNKVSSSNNHSTIQVYPNPAVSVIHVSGAAAGSNFRIVNSSGQTVHNTTQKDINIEKLAKGVYFLQITSGISRQTIKFVKHQ